MSEDILRQAELRHQRRPRSRQGEEILSLDTNKVKSAGSVGERLTAELNVKSSLPPIRGQAVEKTPRSTSPYGHVNTQNADTEKQCKKETVSLDNGLLTPLDRPRTPRRRLASYNEQDDVNGSNGHNPCLPFVKCSINDKVMKALVSSLSQRSTISRRFVENNRTNKNSPPKQINLADAEYHVNFAFEESGIHDIVLGLDFLIEHKCCLDFAHRELKMGSGQKEAFLSEQDIPLKFKNRKDLSLSI